MNPAGTIHCLNCLQPVAIDEVDENGICGHCIALKSKVGLDQEGQPLGADAGVHVEDLHAGGNALLDQREFDGGETLVGCDEV